MMKSNMRRLQYIGWNERLLFPALIVLGTSLSGCVIESSDASTQQHHDVAEQWTPTPETMGSNAMLVPAESTAELDGASHSVYERLLNTDVPESDEATYNAMLEMFEAGLQPSVTARNAARVACYSALTGNVNRSIIMVPLPSHLADLDAVCHDAISGGWHAGGVAKPQNYYQNCDHPLDNARFGAGYTSYVTEAYFESHRGNYTRCGSTNAVVCCSESFPN